MGRSRMLEIEQLGVEFDGANALDNVSITVPLGEITAVIGRNGAGKSTLLKALAGLVTPSRGRFSFAGQELTGMSPSAIVRAGLALVPEGRELFPRMSVMDNLAVGATTVRDPQLRRRNLDRIFALFPVLAKKKDAQAARLSGGEQQMLACGRALMASPRMLLLDEPSIGLAPRVEADLMAAVSLYTRDAGVGVLLVEQNARLALEISSRAYVMELGTVVLAGASADLIGDPAVTASYLG